VASSRGGPRKIRLDGGNRRNGCRSFQRRQRSWLNLVKIFLLDRSSEQITSIQLGSASGVGVPGDRLDPDGPSVRRSILCTIRPVCQASADYCLERAKLARRDELRAVEDLSLKPGEGQNSPAISPMPAKHELPFPKRAAWLQARLAERSWNRNDPLRQRGPDPKTIDRILASKAVREDVLEKLATALSKKFTKVSVLDIPQD
jgi:hypothetical protein